MTHRMGGGSTPMSLLRISPDHAPISYVLYAFDTRYYLRFCVFYVIDHARIITCEIQQGTGYISTPSSTTPALKGSTNMRTASSGPPPKEKTARRRTNTPAAERAGIIVLPTPPAFKARPVNAKWTAPISAMYRSIVESSVPKMQTDVDFAWLLLDTLHHALTHPNLASGQISASLVNNCIGNLARLGVAHNDRIRMGITVNLEATVEERKEDIKAGYRKLMESAA
jgi:hypothetical protein